MLTPPVQKRLRSACLLLAVVDRHRDEIATWFSSTTDLGSPLSADEAAENVRELLESYTSVLVARARVLHALDELVAVDPAVFAVAEPDGALRARLDALRARLRGGVGVLALTRSGLDLALPRRSAPLLERTDAALPVLDRFFSEWPSPRNGPWPSDALAGVRAARQALFLALEQAPTPGTAAVAHATAIRAFDSSMEDAVELVQAMLHLTENPDAASLLDPSWSWPGCFESGSALSEVEDGQLSLLLGGDAGLDPGALGA